MRTKFLGIGLCLLAGLLAGCDKGAVAQQSSDVASAPKSGVTAKDSRSTPEKGEKKVKMTKAEKAEAHRIAMLRERYGPSSTMGNAILITVQDETTGELATVVCEHDFWVRTNKNLHVDRMTQREYEDMMIANGDKPFPVTSDVFAKFKPLASVEPSAEMRAMSMEDIAEKYLEKMPRSKYWTYKPETKIDRTFLRLLLEKGCVLQSNCMDGTPLVRW